MWISHGKELVPLGGGGLLTVFAILVLFAAARTENAADRRAIRFAARAGLLLLFAAALAA